MKASRLVVGGCRSALWGVGTLACATLGKAAPASRAAELSTKVRRCKSPSHVAAWTDIPCRTFVRNCGEQCRHYPSGKPAHQWYCCGVGPQPRTRDKSMPIIFHAT